MASLQSIPQLVVGQFSHPGRRRTNNEDWLGTFQPDATSRQAAKGSLFLVADGMGGHHSGEQASRRAVDHIIRTYMEDTDNDLQSSLLRAIQSANALLHAQATSFGTDRGWGTTVVVAVVHLGTLWVANVGDSRAYLLRKERLQQLSRDHSWAAANSDAGISGNWIGQHIVTRALGRRPVVEVDVLPPIRLQSGDSILLCSDGLTTPVSDDIIRAIMQRYRPQQAAEALVQTANRRGGPDNTSVIVIQVLRLAKSSLWTDIWRRFSGWLRETADQVGSSRRGLAFVRRCLAAVFLFSWPFCFLVAVALLIGLAFAVG